MNQILETTGGSRLREAAKHGGKTREFDYGMLILVCGVGDKRPDNVWLAAEGVYLPVIQRK
nr:unnamed protein product [Digitaria exilis]